MSQAFQELLLKLLSPVVSLLIGFFLERWRNYISRKRPLSKLWGFEKVPTELFIVLTNFTQLTIEYARPTTGRGEILAHKFVNQSIEETFGVSTNINLDFSDEFSSRYNDKDIISIGGPRHNQISKYFRSRYPYLPLYFKYDHSPTVVIDRRAPDDVRQPELKAPGRDFGIISRIPNPNSSNANVVFLIEGAHTYGLAAAGKMFTPDFFSELAKKAGEVPYWQVLVETPIDEIIPKIIKDSFISLDNVQLRKEDIRENAEKISYNELPKTSFSAKKNLVIFCDIGNVLVETAPLIHDAARVASEKCREKFKNIDAEILASTYLAVDKITARPHINHLFGDHAVIMETLKRINGVADIRYAGYFLPEYRKYIRNHIGHNPDVLSFFQKLRRLNNVELGIISDGTTDDQLETLMKLGILSFLNSDLILISEEFGYEKVDTRIFAEGLRRSASRPEYVFMIGDNFERDILLPKELGMRTAFFTKYVLQQPVFTDATKPDIVCNNFDDLFRLLHSEYLKI